MRRRRGSSALPRPRRSAIACSSSISPTPSPASPSWAWSATRISTACKPPCSLSSFFMIPTNMGPVSVRIRPGQSQAALAAVDRIWHRFVPTVAIQRSFQDASFDKFFIDDERQGRIFGIFVGIAIFIACAGPVRAGQLHRRAAHQGNRHPQGLWRAHPRHRAAAAMAIFDSGADRQPDRLAGGLLSICATGCKALPIASASIRFISWARGRRRW